MSLASFQLNIFYRATCFILIIILIPTPRLKGFCKNILCLIFLTKSGIQCHKLATEKKKLLYIKVTYKNHIAHAFGDAQSPR